MQPIQTYIQMDIPTITVSKKLLLTDVHISVLKQLIQDKYIEIRCTRQYSVEYKESLHQLWVMGILELVDDCWHTTYKLNEEIISMEDLKGYICV